MSDASQTRYVFVTGGVVSSLGKGIASASLAAILESRGLKVHMIKLDPYINVDAGTMSPFQHGDRGDYLGSTVQVIPHITDEIQQAILKGVAA